MMPRTSGPEPRQIRRLTVKNTFVYILLLGTGIAIVLGYYNLFPQRELVYDDDQEGLSDQIIFQI